MKQIMLFVMTIGLGLSVASLAHAQAPTTEQIAKLTQAANQLNLDVTNLLNLSPSILQSNSDTIAAVTRWSADETAFETLCFSTGLCNGALGNDNYGARITEAAVLSEIQQLLVALKSGRNDKTLSQYLVAITLSYKSLGDSFKAVDPDIGKALDPYIYNCAFIIGSYLRT